MPFITVCILSEAIAELVCLQLLQCFFSFTLCKKNRQPQITFTLKQDTGNKLKSFKIIELARDGKEKSIWHARCQYHLFENRC
jgi:hypothetical protein